MQISFSFKRMDTSPALRDYAHAKILEKLNKYATKQLTANVFFSIDHREHHTHITVSGGDGFNFVVTAQSPDMYATVDQTIDKLDIQLKRQKERIKNHKKVSNIRDLPIKHQWDKLDADSVPIDAEDLIKYEHARKRLMAG